MPPRPGEDARAEARLGDLPFPSLPCTAARGLAAGGRARGRAAGAAGARGPASACRQRCARVLQAASSVPAPGRSVRGRVAKARRPATSCGGKWFCDTCVVGGEGGRVRVWGVGCLGGGLF